MDEQILYTSLLKGAIIGKLPYANSLALKVADLVKNHNLNVNGFFSELIYYYGNLFEVDEEKELENIINGSNKEAKVKKLIEIEEVYNDYFLEIISKEKTKIEVIFNEVQKRTSLKIEDEDINEISKDNLYKNGNKLTSIWKKIENSEKKSIEDLYKNTYRSVLNYIKLNSGTEDDSNDIWCEALGEFRKKLQKLPDEKGYFQWRPINIKNSNAAKIATFFVLICRNRWLDVLRKTKRNTKSIDELYYSLKAEFELIDFPYNENNEWSFVIYDAIDKLNKRCQEIILGKWFGGEDGGEITFQELSKATGLAVGTMQNYHRGCLEELGKILKSDKI